MNSSSDEEIQEQFVQPSRITSEIEQMLGEANRHFIFQEFDAAIEILQEIIIKSPGIPDPYHVLALIHEEKKEKERSVGFLLLAAQMTQHDSSLWARVGHLYKELEQYKDAIYCFSRALLNQRTQDFEIMKEKAVCYERLEQYRKAGKLYSKILKQANSCDPSIAKALVQVYTIMKQPKSASKELKEVLETKYDEHIINLICDLEIQQQEYSSCIELLEKLGKSHFPLDIETKRGYCLARLGRLLEADSCFEKLLIQSVQHYDDLYLLAGTLYMDLDQHENALKFFEPLLCLPLHNKPALWFKCGRLYYDIQDFKSAEEAFLGVVESNEPALVTQSKLFLSKIYKNFGNIEKSISVLKTRSLELEENFEVSDEILWQMISNAKLKIEESGIKQDLEEMVKYLSHIVETEIKLEVKKREDLVNGIGLNLLHESFIKLINDLNDRGKLAECKEFIIKLLKLNMYRDSLRKELKLLLTSVCVKDQDYDQAINAFKYICEKENSDSNWITMSALMRKAEKPQLRSWLCKLVNKLGDSYPVHMLLGNSYFQTGNYSLAIKQYLQVYSLDDPVINLQLGLSHLFSLCSRNLQKKEESFDKAFKYLRFYVKYRKKVNYFEAYFNLARAYHHILFFAKAKKYYEKVLRAEVRNRIYGGLVDNKVVVMAVKNLAAIRNELDDEGAANRLMQDWDVDKLTKLLEVVEEQMKEEALKWRIVCDESRLISELDFLILVVNKTKFELFE